MRSEHSWSLLDPRPVLVKLEHLDEHIVYWNGIATTHLMAMNFALEHFGVYPTPEMKTAMEQNFSRIYYANGFATRAWDVKVASAPIYSLLKVLLRDHCKTVIVDQKRDITEVLGWFNYDRSRVLDSLEQ